MISAPIYVGLSNTYEKNLGIQLMNEALKIAEASIKSKGGSFLLKTQVKLVIQF